MLDRYELLKLYNRRVDIYRTLTIIRRTKVAGISFFCQCGFSGKNEKFCPWCGSQIYFEDKKSHLPY